jgi:hypothetical protein
MGRKSKLTDAQWAEIGRRLLEGESVVALAREFAVGESSIRSHFERKGESSPKVREVADMLFQAESALSTLPPDAQVSAINLATKLRSISENLACAAENSSATALRLSALANSEVQKVDDAEPVTKTRKHVESAIVLTKAANDAAHISLNLVSANRDAIKRIHETPTAPGSGELTQERLREGARRIAFILHREAAQETT